MAVLVFSTKFRVLLFGAWEKKGENKTHAETQKKNNLTTRLIKIHFGEDTRSFLSSLNVVGVVVDRLRTTTEQQNEYQ